MLKSIILMIFHVVLIIIILIGPIIFDVKVKDKRFYIFITCPEGATINWGDDSDESNIKKILR